MCGIDSSSCGFNDKCRLIGPKNLIGPKKHDEEYLYRGPELYRLRPIAQFAGKKLSYSNLRGLLRVNRHAEEKGEQACSLI